MPTEASCGQPWHPSLVVSLGSQSCELPALCFISLLAMGWGALVKQARASNFYLL